MSNIQAGRYLGRATGAFDFGLSNGGKEQVSVALELLNEGVQGTTVVFHGSFASAQSTEITLRQLRDLGWTCDDVFALTGLGSVDVDVVIKYETYEGKERMKVAVYGQGGMVKQAKPLDASGKAGLAARLKGAILKSRPAAAAQAGRAAGVGRPAWAGALPAGAPPPAQRNGAAPEWDGQGANPYGPEADQPDVF